MKKIMALMVMAMMMLAACGGTAEPDYTTQELETALNNGEDPTGKTVAVTVDEFVPDSAFGYNIQTGEHLNFVSDKNPGVQKGDEIVVEVTEVQSVLGSFIIGYEKQ